MIRETAVVMDMFDLPGSTGISVSPYLKINKEFRYCGSVDFLSNNEIRYSDKEGFYTIKRRMNG